MPFGKTEAFSKIYFNKGNHFGFLNRYSGRLAHRLLLWFFKSDAQSRQTSKRYHCTLWHSFLADCRCLNGVCVLSDRRYGTSFLWVFGNIFRLFSVFCCIFRFLATASQKNLNNFSVFFQLSLYNCKVLCYNDKNWVRVSMEARCFCYTIFEAIFSKTTTPWETDSETHKKDLMLCNFSKRSIFGFLCWSSWLRISPFYITKPM